MRGPEKLPDESFGALVAGVDPGVQTGLALWSPVAKKFFAITTTTIIKAMDTLTALREAERLNHVVIEDARLRTFFGNKGREALQGAGDIKGQCRTWAEFCEVRGIPMRAFSPHAKGAKVSDPWFRKHVADVRTSNHSRDAAMLVFGASIRSDSK